MAATVTNLSEATIDEVLGSSAEPVVVDFWAEWCGPCKMIAPVLEEIAKEQGGKVAVAKLNVDEAPNVAIKYKVMSIPTLIVFKDGVEVSRTVGARGKSQLLETLSPYL